MDSLTICTVSFNACDALALMWESFLKYHSVEVRWFVYDNGSIDGAKEYAQEHADLVIHGDNSLGHGECLSELCTRVETSLILSVDNDIEFIAPCLDRMREPLISSEVYCSCFTRLEPFGFADIWGERYQAQWSPNIALGLMKTENVKRILQAGITFGYYLNHTRREFFETGAMFYRVALACGWRVAELADLWQKAVHYGSVSTLWLNESIDPQQKEDSYREAIQRRYENIQSRLCILRAGR